MDGLGARLPAGVDDLVDQQIGLRGLRRADMHLLVGHLDMERAGIGVGIDGNRRDPHLPGGLDDTAGDLAPVGDQNLLEHETPNALFRAVLDRCARPGNHTKDEDMPRRPLILKAHSRALRYRQAHERAK